MSYSVFIGTFVATRKQESPCFVGAPAPVRTGDLCLRRAAPGHLFAVCSAFGRCFDPLRKAQNNGNRTLSGLFPKISRHPVDAKRHWRYVVCIERAMKPARQTEMKMKKTLHEKIIEAEQRGSKWLADGNEYAERGMAEKAERCYEKSQFWLDRYNKLVGNQ